MTELALHDAPDPAQSRLPGGSWSRPERQRALGLVVGGAVGDALGAPFEFKAAGLYSATFPEPVLGGRGEMTGGGSFGWAPGEFTDDTQMAMVLARSLLAQGHYDPDDLWAGWRHWARTAVDVGSTTSRSLSFERWRDVVVDDPERAAGNGALMRAFPLALAYLDAPDDVARWVVRHQALLTHQHPAAGWGAWLGVAMMRAGVRGDDPFEVLEREVASLPDPHRARYAQLLDPAWTPDQPGPGNGSVWACLAQAVWAVRTTPSFEQAVVAAIDLGRDTDTVACVAGAIAGARDGIQAIPSRWATYVHGSIDTAGGRVNLSASDLQELALALLGTVAPPEVPGEPAVGPVEVADGVHAANLLGATTVPADWAVISLCRTGDTFAAHPHRRQLYLVDQDGDHNGDLHTAVRDAVRSIEAFRHEGRQVVVHCHGGRSRTGLVLKAWKMHRDGVRHGHAHDWLAERWPLYEDYNARFRSFLDGEWGSAT